MMKFKNIKWLLMLLVLPMFVSCSWEELPTYDEANITAVQFRYRWASDVYLDDITGEPLILEVQLNASANINAEAGTIDVAVTVPGAQSYFTPQVRDQISLNNLCCQVTLSTAARIAPADGNKVLGIPDNWSTPHKFIVTAADGSTKEWTITVTALNK